ncbi:uncharacterized protein PV09_01739 [Verruconis gallopava]|uniref:Uncharacterized protein n=1 Tax=Verruconis gallopava TaxID=253628 RepID=A0A0D2AMS8_9PEZI|nr:uncharacterized protein PV09_01739 [Verruconis gallopava]KIW07820.1 hypothetical protein PV09_01739 [Verruconis gallopava]
MEQQIHRDTLSSTSDERNSLLYSVIPKIVRTRIRKISSLRRSMSQYTISTEVSLPNNGGQISEVFPDLGTPPPGYRSRISLSEPESDNEGDLDLPLRPMSACSSVDPLENNSGILWIFANQGLSLLNIAAQEDKRRPQGNNTDSKTSLSRSLYIHGVTYLLRGLPKNLTVDEKMSVWSSVPPEVQQIAPIASSPEIGQLAQCQSSTETARPGSSSILKQVIASMVVQIFIITHFLFPYIKHCLAILYKYERKHKVSERVLACSVHTCESFMKTGLQVTGAIGRMNDGKVGQALNDMSVWWISGVTAGIHQGIGDGLAIVGAKDVDDRGPESKKRR